MSEVSNTDLTPANGAQVGMKDLSTLIPELKRFSKTDFEAIPGNTVAQKLSRPSLSYWQDAWIRLKKNKQAIVSLGAVIFMVLFTLLGPVLWRVDHSYQDLSRISEPPSFAKAAVVLGDAQPWEDVILSDFPERPAEGQAVNGAELAAPDKLELVGEATTQSVSLKWSPVQGASGYVVYRSTEAPEEGRLGVPIYEVEGGNHVSYQDQFNLENTTYHYSIVAKNGDESLKFTSVKVVLGSSISLADAQALLPDAKAGDVIRLPAHPMGTDSLGRDMLARMMEGARVSLFIGFVAPLLWVLIGIFIGGVSGYAGGKTDQVLMRGTDFVLALPFLLFMILFKVAMGAGAGESGIVPMLVSMVVLSWPGAARLTRGQILQLRESEFVQAARLLGAKPMYLIFRHLVPNTMGVILVALTSAIPGAIFTEAFLSFIGMGVVPPTPSWGSMCNDGLQTFLVHPHEFFFPALFISITVLAFNRLGDGLRDALDPKMRSVE